jgi:hypothetical protein
VIAAAVLQAAAFGFALDAVRIDLVDITASGLLALAILLLFFGKLHTDNAYRTLERAYLAQASAAEKLRDVSEVQATTIQKQLIISEIVSRTIADPRLKPEDT